jgi:hypothetical protein
MINNLEVNSIDNIGFTNPNSNPNWNQADGDKDGIYFGQLDPNWRKNTEKILDEQRDEMIRLENQQREDSLPKEIAIFGGGALVLLTILIIYKYAKK